MSCSSVLSIINVLQPGGLVEAHERYALISTRSGNTFTFKTLILLSYVARYL